MRRIIAWCEVLVLACAGAAVFSPPAAAVADAIMAVVNDDVVTMRDLREYMASIASQMKLEGASPEQVQTSMRELEDKGLDRLIEEKIILSEAKRQEVLVRDEVVNERLNEIRGRYASQKDFVAALMAEGASITQLKGKIRDQLKIRFLVEREIRSRLFVNPQEVNDYYKNHFERFRVAERADVASIFIARGDDPEAARQKAEEALAAVKEGKDFVEAMKTWSQRSHLGMVEKGKYLPEIDKVLFSLKEGEVSDVVAVRDGFYIFKIKKNFPPTVALLDEVKDRITHMIFEEKFKARFTAWVEKLKKEAYIEIKR